LGQDPLDITVKSIKRKYRSAERVRVPAAQKILNDLAKEEQIAVTAAKDLTEEDREKIYKMAGEGFSQREIVTTLNKEKRIHLRCTSITRVLETPQAQKSVSKYRMEFLKTVKEIPIADKKVRLDDMENIRQRLKQILNNTHFDRGDKYVAKFLNVSRRLIEILDMARNEMEPKSGISIGIGLGQGELGELTDEQLQQERNSILRKAGIAVQRGSSEIDEAPEGDETKDHPGSAEVLLATPEELQRERVQDSSPFVPNLRQQKSYDTGLPTV